MINIEHYRNPYIHFEDGPENPHRKTRHVLIVNTKSDVHLANISWYGAWRQYVMRPFPGT